MSLYEFKSSLDKIKSPDSMQNNIVNEKSGTLRLDSENKVHCSKGRRRILLVEDNKLIASIHKTLLSELKCDVDIAVNGKEALSMATPDYDLILLDIGLPDIMGTKLASILKHRFQDQCPPMIAITALSEEDAEELKKSKEVGIKQVFVKPVNADIFKKILSLFASDLPYYTEREC